MVFDQITNRILMVRPARFGFNPETASSNSFQQTDDRYSREEIALFAVQEFDDLVQALLAREIEVYVVQDTAEPAKTDAVFPNNWISIHQNGLAITYPMMSANRRLEIRGDMLEDLQMQFAIDEIWRLDAETSEQFLEGTGSMVLDRRHRIVYACRSPRTDESLLSRFCQRMEFRQVLFDAVYTDDVPFYHTNVVMALTEQHAILCIQSVTSSQQRKSLENSLRQAGKEIIEIDFDQVGKFAGNMLQVARPGGRPLLVMSNTALESLHDHQLSALESESEILAAPIPVIEKYGGGSVRCMMAEIFVPHRNG